MGELFIWHAVSAREESRLLSLNHCADWVLVFDVSGLVARPVVLSIFRKELPGEAIGLLSIIDRIFGLCLRDAHPFEFGD